MKPKRKKKKATLQDMIKAAHDAGVQVRISLQDKRMPLRFPDDPESVRLLLDESERLNKMGNRWLDVETPNHIAAEMTLRHGWAYALSGAWLRARLKGELGPHKE